MVKFYVNRIKNGAMTLEEVPSLWKKKVEAVLLLSIVGLSSNLKLLVAMRLGVTPVPIPNTMVKT